MLPHKFNAQQAETNRKVRQALRADIEMTIGLGRDLLAAGVITTAQLSAETKAKYQELSAMLDSLNN